MNWRKNGLEGARIAGSAAGVRGRSGWSLAAGMAVLLGGCAHERPGERTIEVTRTATARSEIVIPGATAEMRFGASPTATTTQVRPQSEIPLVWATPPGWTELDSTQMRMANFQVGDDPLAECYLTLLPGSAGGLVENVNRWRSQMGLGPYDAVAVQEMPKRSLVGLEATYVDLEGRFTGMSAQPIEEARLVGAIASLPMGTIFVKMTGPAASLEGEVQAFEYFLASIGLSDLPEEPGGGTGATGATGNPGASAPPSAAGLTYTRPDGWTPEQRQMRALSFRLGDSGTTECYVSVLGGSAGGVQANLGRWARQLGLEAPSQAEIDAMELLPVLDADSRLYEGYGSYQGMTGERIDEAGMLGVVCELGSQTVFVKMIGPAEEVRAERANFVLFCTSLGVG